MHNYVTESSGPASFGRDWLNKIQLNWKTHTHKKSKCLQNISSANGNARLDKISKRYPSVFFLSFFCLFYLFIYLFLFQDGIGSITDFKVAYI